MWTHYVARDLKPELLNDLPGTATSPARVKQANGAEEAVNGVEEAAKVNGEEAGCGEDSRDSGVVEQDESSEKPAPEANETPPAVADSGAAATVEEKAEESKREEAEEKAVEDEPKDNGVSGEKSKLPENGVEAAAQDNGVEAAAQEEGGQEGDQAAAAVNGVTPNGVDCTENGLKEDFSAKEADQPQSNGDSTKEVRKAISQTKYASVFFYSCLTIVGKKNIW